MKIFIPLIFAKLFYTKIYRGNVNYINFIVIDFNMEESLLKLSEIAEDMDDVINAIIKNGLNKDIVLDEFKKQKQLHYNKLLSNAIKDLSKVNNKIEFEVKKYQSLIRIKELIDSVIGIQGKYQQIDMLEIIKELKNSLPKIQKVNIDFEINNLPNIIKTEVLTDLAEAKKCFDNSCFRSCTILCGRVLETCLHRKYFELTRKDILETSPGVGLGKLIAKLKELNVGFDPGITEQIHLINKIRIDSVHTKQVTFNPSRSQAHAMILYTVDVINKLF